VLTLKEETQKRLEAQLAGMREDDLQERLGSGSTLEESQHNIERFKQVLFNDNNDLPVQNYLFCESNTECA